MRRAWKPVVVLVSLLLVTQIGCGEGEPGPDEPAQPPEAATESGSVTVPFTLDHNRIVAEVALIQPDGLSQKARAWFDIGTDALIVSESLAKKLGLDTSILQGAGGHGSVESPSPCPRVRVGGVTLETTGIPLRIYPGDSTAMGLAADVHLPAGIFRGSHVIFDYPVRRLTVAAPGLLEPQGLPVACRVNADTGLIMIDTSVDDEIVAVGIDTGSAGTWMSREVTSGWQTTHPKWPVTIGALGSTNFWGRDFETAGTLMSIPVLTIGTLQTRDIAVLGLSQGIFDWYSRKSAGPVAGIIGGNVLKGFRLEVDWPGSTTFWRAGPAEGVRDLDIVGLTLRPEADGSYTVAGVAKKGGETTVAGIQAGDRLIRVGSMETAGEAMGDVAEALRGPPGDVRVLELERDGRRYTVETPVRRFP